jgi:hypothetical protein
MHDQPHMPAKYTNIVIEPSLPDWVAKRSIPENELIAELRNSARRRIVDTAQQFILRLHEIAKESGLPEVNTPLLTGDADSQPIVMTGHQPTVFHPGLVFKYEQTEQFAAAHNAIAVGIVIDSDEGDPGSFAFPSPLDNTAEGQLGLAITSESLARSAALYPTCQLKTTTQLRAMSHRVAAAIQETAGTKSPRGFLAILDQYTQLTTTSMMDANLIVRRQNGIGSRLLELPLTAFSTFPETLHVFADITTRAIEFAETHNNLLAAFRREENIKNVANPFPDLRIESTTCELPFWVLDVAGNSRRIASVRKLGTTCELLANDECVLSWNGRMTPEHLDALTAGGLQLIPRGALITGSMRLLTSDLFVHGTGGAKYDRFTDRLLKIWWNVEPTPFVVASASRFLFPHEQDELKELDDIALKLRDLSHNPQRFVGTGVFSSDLEASLQQLIAQKQSAVQELKQARETGQSGKELGRQLQQLTGQIRQAVEAEFQPQIERQKSVSKETRTAVASRTWPWFLFADNGSP